MRTSLAAALTAAAVAATLLAAALLGTPPARAAASRTLVVAVPGPFAGCDPGAPGTTASTDAVLGLVLPSAFTPGPLDAPVGDTNVISQAEVVAETPQTVDYTIAPTARWADGRPLEPADLVRTWHERRHDRVLADLGYRDVASVRSAPAATGVVAVTFRHAYADWDSLFNLIVPAGTAGSRCTLPSARRDPSMGPYGVVTATSSSLTLRANPRWPGPAPAYTQVDVTTDPATPPPAGSTARLAYLPSPTLDQLQALGSTGGYAARTQHDTTIVSLDFAVHGPAALAPWLRQAVARIVDRAALVARVAAPIDDTAAPAASHLVGQGEPRYSGATGTPVSAPTAPAMAVPGASGAAAYGDVADPQAAGAALRAHGFVRTGAGWVGPEGVVEQICLDVPAAPTLRDVAAVLAEQLRAGGLVVDLQPRTSVGEVVRDLRTGECATGVVRRTGDGFATHAAASWLVPSAPAPLGLSWTGVDDPVVAADAKFASGVLNPDEAAPTWDAMDARLWDLMVSLPLFSPSVFVGWSPNVAGVLATDTLESFVAQVPTLLPSSTNT